MMQFPIHDYVGVGPLQFGMGAEQVREVLHHEPELLPGKAEDPAFPTEFYEALRLLVYYRAPGICVAVEFGDHTVADPTLLGESLLGRPYEEVERWFTSIDDEVDCHGTGLTSLRYGVGLYAPSAVKEPSALVEGVIVFARGYYDE